MPSLLATIDTSVLVSLQSAEVLAEVSVLFERILVPGQVRKELEAGGGRNRDALKAIADFAIFERCEGYDPAQVKWLLDTRASLGAGGDQGEAEAVVQAAQRSAMVLTDDGLGREWSRSRAIECHGTVWICYELRRTGYLGDLRSYYVRLLKRGRHQPLAAMNHYLQEMGEPPISEREYLGYTARP